MLHEENEGLRRSLAADGDPPELVFFVFVPASDEAIDDIYGPRRSRKDSTAASVLRYYVELGVWFDVEPWPVLQEARHEQIERERKLREPDGRVFEAFAPPDVASIVHDATVAVASSGLTATVLALVKAWVD